MTEGIVPNPGINGTLSTMGPGGNVLAFKYSGGTAGMFAVQPGATLPQRVMMSPGMPMPPYMPTGQWDFVGLGDVDADGDQDIFAQTTGVANQSQNAQLWVGKNDGLDNFSFAPVSGGSNTPWDNSVPVWSGTPMTSTPWTWGDQQIADFTGDGRADLLGRVRETGEWYLWETNSTGSGFLPRTLWGTWNTGVEWRDVMVGNFDGVDADGKVRADLIGRQVNQLGTVDNWYIGRGVGGNRGVVGVAGNTWWLYGSSAHNSETTWANAVVGDFNGDGKSDLAVRQLYARNSDGSRDGQWVKFSTNAPNALATVTNWASWRHADPNGVDLYWRDFQTGDFDGDGRADIIARRQSGTWQYLSGNGTAAVAVGTWASNYSQTVAGDFDGNGRVDLAVRNSTDNQWYISWSTGTVGTAPNFNTLVNKGGGSTTINTTVPQHFWLNRTSGGAAPRYLGTSDPLGMHQDGARYNAYGGSTTVIDPHWAIGRYHADGTWNWEDYGGGVPLVGKTVNYQIQGDFNGDRLFDMLIGVNESGMQKWYIAINKGNVFVTTLTNASWMSMMGNRQVYFSDFTGDGRADLLSQTTSGSWYLNAANATGTNFITTTYNVLNSAPNGWTQGGQIGNFNGGPSLPASNQSDDLTICLPRPGNSSIYDVLIAWSVPFNSAAPPASVTWTVTTAFTRTLNVGSTLVNGTISSISQDLMIGDIDGNGVEDIASLQNVSVIVGPPMLTASCAEIWVGYCGTGGPTSGGEVNLVIDPAFPGAGGFGYIPLASINRRFIGRFQGAPYPANPANDIYCDLALEYNGRLTVWKKTGAVFVKDISIAVSPTSERYGLTGDIDHDKFDDIVWPGTTGDIPATMMVANTIAWVNPVMTGINTPFMPMYWISTSLRKLSRWWW
ncbi:MAG: VCBS repeat-containing protein [Planctomycetaceae bacterium]